MHFVCALAWQNIKGNILKICGNHEVLNVLYMVNKGLVTLMYSFERISFYLSEMCTWNYISTYKFSNLYNDIICSSLSLGYCSTVKPPYNKDLGTMKISLFKYQFSHYIRIKSMKYKEQGPAKVPSYNRVCYIRPLYNEVPLYKWLESFIFSCQ